MEHSFTQVIRDILKKNFGANSQKVYDSSLLIQYINEKTRSASRGSKSRSSFANLYAIYVIIEDYVNKGFNVKGDYSLYAGAMFRDIFKRQRELPFGGSLQNHGLNNRMNSEFQKFYKTSTLVPIVRDLTTQRYWINDSLIKFEISEGLTVNVAESILEIIDAYISTKQDAFQLFIKSCEELIEIGKTEPTEIEKFIIGLIAPKQDARLFEIVSYSILKYFYTDKSIFWGFTILTISEENLKLYKTGRTNANDGGIDFVMKPLGTFFQVTETVDFKKYFLDIDKIQRYPITFVIKSDESKEILFRKIEANAMKSYNVRAVVDKYMACIEEIINIPILKENFRVAIEKGHLKHILDEIILQSKVEFNVEDEEDIEEENPAIDLQLFE